MNISNRKASNKGTLKSHQHPKNSSETCLKSPDGVLIKSKILRKIKGFLLSVQTQFMWDFLVSSIYCKCLMNSSWIGPDSLDTSPKISPYVVFNKKGCLKLFFGWNSYTAAKLSTLGFIVFEIDGAMIE